MSDLVEKFLTDANINNLIQYVLHDCQDAGDISNVDIEFQEWRNRYKVSLGLLNWHISVDFMPRFWLLLDKGVEGWEEICQAIEAEDGSIKEFISVRLDDLPTVYESTDPFYELMGEDFTNVDRKLEGLVTASAATIRELAKIINAQMELVTRNRDIVKDFDGILTFDTATGKDFKLSLCFDKVPPIAENNTAMIMRTPITQEDAELYLGDIHPKIVSRLDHINKLVETLLTGKAVTKHPELLDYAAMGIDVTLTKAFLNQIVTYISFGGIDDWRMNGDDSPNNIACFKILDDEVEHIIKELEALPKQEGVDLYSLDIDTLAAFGRNNDNRVVTPAVQGFTEPKLLSRYSKGFERLLGIRLGMSDNAHFFRA